MTTPYVQQRILELRAEQARLTARLAELGDNPPDFAVARIEKMRGIVANELAQYGEPADPPA